MSDKARRRRRLQLQGSLDWRTWMFGIGVNVERRDVMVAVLVGPCALAIGWCA